MSNCVSLNIFKSWFLEKIIKIFTTRCQILKQKCTKIDFGWGSDPDGELTVLPRFPSWNKGDLLLREGIKTDRKWKFQFRPKPKVTPKAGYDFRPKPKLHRKRPPAFGRNPKPKPKVHAIDLSLYPRVRMWTWINLYIFADFMLINVNKCNKNISAHTPRHIQYIQLYLVRCQLFWSTPISGFFLVTLYNY